MSVSLTCFDPLCGKTAHQNVTETNATPMALAMKKRDKERVPDLGSGAGRVGEDLPSDYLQTRTDHVECQGKPWQ